MRRAAGYVSAAVIGIVLFHAGADAAVPEVISFQAKLADAGGVASGDAVDVVFALYSTATGGAAVWSETINVDPDAEGVFSAVLGSTTTFASQSVDFSVPLWLGVTVGTDLEMTPRFELAAAPYAMRAVTAGAADTATTLGAVTESDVTTLQTDVAANTTAIGGKADTAHDHDAAYVDVGGDTMTGALVLSGDPAAALEAATKQYVDAAAAAGGIASVAGVSNPGGDVDLVAGTGILVTPDDGNDQVTIDAVIGTGSGEVAAGDHVHAVGDLTDATITSVADDEVFAYDNTSSRWINQTPAEAGLAAATHPHSSLDASDGNPADAFAIDAAGNCTAIGRVDVDDLYSADLVSGERYQVGAASAIDDDYIYFDDAVTEYLRWEDATGEFDLSNDLSVNGTVSATGFVGDGSGLTGLPSIATSVSNATDVVVDADSDDNGSGEISLQTRGVARVTVANDGTVGIGVATPGVMFNVADAFRVHTAGAEPNIIGGYSGSAITAGSVGVTLFGGTSDYSGAPYPNRVTDNYGTIGGGIDNLAGDDNGDPSSAEFATVAGGRINRATSQYATVAGGYAVLAGGSYATGCGGQGNNATGGYSFVGGGYDNDATQSFATVVGGNGNQAIQPYATVGGGQDNDANLAHSTVAGGQLNTANNVHAAIGGGQSNNASGQHSTIAGGLSNTASNSYATVAGGWGNIASSSSCTIGGGMSNQARSADSTVGGGSVNTAGLPGFAATVSGGQSNTATGAFTTVVGGNNNNATGNYSTVFAGIGNTASGDYAAAAGRQAQATDNGSFVWADSSAFAFASTVADEFSARCVGGARFVSAINGAGAPTAGVVLPAGLSAWGSLSDRDAKKDFVPVDGDEILRKVSRMPVTRWRYTWQDETATPLIGPVAQDLIGEFYPGEDDTLITTQQADGVHFAAIKALEKRTRELRDENAALTEKVQRLEAMLEALAGVVGSQ